MSIALLRARAVLRRARPSLPLEGQSSRDNCRMCRLFAVGCEGVRKMRQRRRQRMKLRKSRSSAPPPPAWMSLSSGTSSTASNPAPRSTRRLGPGAEVSVAQSLTLICNTQGEEAPRLGRRAGRGRGQGLIRGVPHARRLRRLLPRPPPLGGMAWKTRLLRCRFTRRTLKLDEPRVSWPTSFQLSTWASSGARAFQ